MDFDWEFDRIETLMHPQYGRVIMSLRWHLYCREGDAVAVDYGNLSLGAPDPVRFIPEGHLPKSKAIEWVIQSLANTDMNVEARKRRLEEIVREEKREL